jgi:hypothetical protein
MNIYQMRRHGARSESPQAGLKGAHSGRAVIGWLASAKTVTTMAESSSLKDILSKISDGSSLPRINISLTDGNRLTLIAWQLLGDCLLECSPKGNPRHLVPLAQIVAIEIPSED